ncbi:acetyl-CoA C-acetyltransferase [Nicoliella spurrieriana]|uniref:acetyl-CoA C-acetyltransferase n=1 Tax=Nicoliella spurrieriana TaxID=2925830 RepID=A0A976RT00_9LACO|nr:acetyl-CoA C-acetyltransferase [Nicoliella spurrieriana]UQS87184.1 acetyl-CoA C-acetyltransferase [Nicoliella spurrieriana]
MEEVVIVSAVRTPIGKFGGALSNHSSVELGTIVTKEAIKRAALSPAQIDQVIFGNVLSAGAGQNIARQIQIQSDIPESKTAFTVNQVCGSGLRAVRSGQAAIAVGDAEIVVVGGTESMSNAPFLNHDMRFGHKMGAVNIEDSIQKDALTDAFSGAPMGLTAEKVAEQFNITRQQQDEFAFQSYQKAITAQDNGTFNDEIIPIDLPNGTQINSDESVRRDTNLAKLARLKPAFKAEGSVTAGNAASLNDGASALVLMTKQKALELGIHPLATINGYKETGIDPSIMGYAPYYAIKELAKSQGISVNAFEQVELNEAFAAQALAVINQLGIHRERVNATGGAIALGHPLGDSGSRIIVTLINNLKRNHQHRGLASLCIGGGMGMAIDISV